MPTDDWYSRLLEVCADVYGTQCRLVWKVAGSNGPGQPMNNGEVWCFLTAEDVLLQEADRLNTYYRGQREHWIEYRRLPRAADKFFSPDS